MTKDEAEAFLDRNPRIKQRLLAFDAGTLKKLDQLWEFGLAENADDALVNLIPVARAMGLIKQKSPGGG
jgi:hypothetical protein